MISLLHYKQNWEKLSGLISFCEVTFESAPQVIFQAFIIMLLFDEVRCATWIQIVTITTSGIMVLIISIKTMISQRMYKNENDNTVVALRILIDGFDTLFEKYKFQPFHVKPAIFFLFILNLAEI